MSEDIKNEHVLLFWKSLLLFWQMSFLIKCFRTAKWVIWHLDEATRCWTMSLLDFCPLREDILRNSSSDFLSFHYFCTFFIFCYMFQYSNLLCCVAAL